MHFLPKGNTRYWDKGELWSRKMTFSSAETRRAGLRNECAWNSPISARSFPKIEKATFLVPALSLDGHFHTQGPGPLCRFLPSPGASFEWKEHWIWSQELRLFPWLLSGINSGNKKCGEQGRQRCLKQTRFYYLPHCSLILSLGGSQFTLSLPPAGLSLCKCKATSHLNEEGRN